MGSLSCWVSERIKSLQQGLAQLLSTLAHLVGREDHHRIGAGVRGAGRCFLFFCRRLTHGEQDAVFPLGQLFGGRPSSFCWAILVRFWTAISLSTSTSTSPAPFSSAIAFFAFTTGSGQASPSGINFQHSFPSLSYVLFRIGHNYFGVLLLCDFSHDLCGDAGFLQLVPEVFQPLPEPRQAAVRPRSGGRTADFLHGKRHRIDLDDRPRCGFGSADRRRYMPAGSTPMRANCHRTPAGPATALPSIQGDGHIAALPIISWSRAPAGRTRSRPWPA